MSIVNKNFSSFEDEIQEECLIPKMNHDTIEYKRGNEKSIIYFESHESKKHGGKVDVKFHPNSCLFQIYFQDRLMFEYADDIEFEKIYYRSKVDEDTILIHIIFDKNSVMYEELEYLEFYFLVTINDVYFVERLCSPYMYQIFMNNLGKDYKLVKEFQTFLDFQCLFQNQNVDEFKKIELDSFPILDLSLESFITTVLQMKCFTF